MTVSLGMMLSMYVNAHTAIGELGKISCSRCFWSWLISKDTIQIWPSTNSDMHKIDAGN